MVLRTVHGGRRAESGADLRTWLTQLTGCPPVTETVLLACSADAHQDEPSTWFYVEADRDSGVARRRCLACGRVAAVLDSEEHWTHPPVWSCTGCSNSIVEVAAGLAVAGGAVTWVAIGVRCVDCGTVAGVTDLHVASRPLGEVVAEI
ncbi:MAG TPA: hypothetical protein VNG13_02430 [Mycobacteriales bacterium]|nr:hypothetical protein [Mycobacteriales bacterium]